MEVFPDDFIMQLVDRGSERARGFSRFILQHRGVDLPQFGIMSANTAKEIITKISDDKTRYLIRELTEEELMARLMKGWRMRG